MQKWHGVEQRGSCKISEPWSFLDQCNSYCIHPIRKTLSSPPSPGGFPRTQEMETCRAEPWPKVAMSMVGHTHFEEKHTQGFLLRSQLVLNGWVL